MDILKTIMITNDKTYDSGMKIINQLMDVPTAPYIDIAKKIYDMYGIIDNSGNITKMAYLLTQFSSMPINRTLFMFYSYKLHCVKEACIIISMMESLGGKITNLFYKSDSMCGSNCSKPSAQTLIKKLVQKSGDHLTYLKIYQEFKSTTDQKAWAKQYGIRLDSLNRADRDFRSTYYMVLNMLRTPKVDGIASAEQSRTDSDRPVSKQLIQALKESHRHLTAVKMVPTFPKKKAEASVNKDSAILYTYDRKTLAKKTFIFDELIKVSGNWEYTNVTVI